MRVLQRGFISTWALSAVGLAAVGLGTLGVACSGRDVSYITSDQLPAVAPDAETGQLQLALTSRGASGALYRLRQANFQVFSTDPFGGSFAFLSSENDPLSTSLEATLDIGNYQILLFSDWFLEKVVGTEVTRVQARLLSSETQNFSISANDETHVQYRFETNGEIIEFGQGRLIVEIEVDEQNSPPPPSGDAGPPGTLGEPLQIVGGTIAPNPLGINAALFSVTAPIGTDLAITSDTDQICVRGSTQPVQNNDFATQWGGLFGLGFLSEEGTEQPFALAGGEVTGFAFTVSGPVLPPMRFNALPGGADPNTVTFCAPLESVPASVEMPLEQLTESCWNPGNPPLRTMSLTNITWSIVSDPVLAHPFDFCISDLRPILR